MSDPSYEFQQLQVGDEVRILSYKFNGSSSLNEYTSANIPNCCLEVVEARTYTVIATDGSKNYKIHHTDMYIVSSFYKNKKKDAKTEEDDTKTEGGTTERTRNNIGVGDEVVCMDDSRMPHLDRNNGIYYVKRIRILPNASCDKIWLEGEEHKGYKYLHTRFKLLRKSTEFSIFRETKSNNLMKEEDVPGGEKLQHKVEVDLIMTKEDMKMSENTTEQLTVFDVEIYNISDLKKVTCEVYMVATRDSGKARDEALIKYVNEFEVEDTEDLEIIPVEKFKVTKRCKNK